jgi:hypothetical protein
MHFALILMWPPPPAALPEEEGQTCIPITVVFVQVFQVMPESGMTIFCTWRLLKRCTLAAEELCFDPNHHIPVLGKFGYALPGHSFF